MFVSCCMNAPREINLEKKLHKSEMFPYNPIWEPKSKRFQDDRVWMKIVCIIKYWIRSMRNGILWIGKLSIRRFHFTHGLASILIRNMYNVTQASEAILAICFYTLTFGRFFFHLGFKSLSIEDARAACQKQVWKLLSLRNKLDGASANLLLRSLSGAFWLTFVFKNKFRLKMRKRWKRIIVNTIQRSYLICDQV